MIGPRGGEGRRPIRGFFPQMRKFQFKRWGSIHNRLTKTGQQFLLSPRYYKEIKGWARSSPTLLWDKWEEFACWFTQR